jgi:hypothetical protein
MKNLLKSILSYGAVTLMVLFVLLWLAGSWFGGKFMPISLPHIYWSEKSMETVKVYSQNGKHFTKYRLPSMLILDKDYENFQLKTVYVRLDKRCFKDRDFYLTHSILCQIQQLNAQIPQHIAYWKKSAQEMKLLQKATSLDELWHIADKKTFKENEHFFDGKGFYDELQLTDAGGCTSRYQVEKAFYPPDWVAECYFSFVSVGGHGTLRANIRKRQEIETTIKIFRDLTSQWKKAAEHD